MTTNKICPCGSSLPYSSCCEHYHLGTALAETAEKLMRSRYSAFVNQNIDYLLKTHHPSQQAANERESLSQSISQTLWLGLHIRETTQGTPNDETGTVEFVAEYKVASGSAGLLCEKSNFIKEDGVWFYLNGEIKDLNNLGRNDPCWCGSGKKFKRCHG